MRLLLILIMLSVTPLAFGDSIQTQQIHESTQVDLSLAVETSAEIPECSGGRKNLYFIALAGAITTGLIPFLTEDVPTRYPPILPPEPVGVPEPLTLLLLGTGLLGLATKIRKK